MIEITSELSDLEVMQSKHTMPHIFYFKKLATGLQLAKLESNIIAMIRGK